MQPFVQKVKKTIARYKMLKRGEQVVVAVSGGADSLALLHALVELQEDFQLSLVVAHLDHGLRPEAAAEKSFVQKSAAKWGIPFVHGRADVRARQRAQRLTLQEAAREARYAFLLETAGARKADKIALGHTADDQAETVVMRLLRGSGSRGLAGIPPLRQGVFIRPLLQTWRQEVEEFLRVKEISYLRDPSNFSLRYLRNRVRRELLPLLQQYNPRIRQTLVQTAELFRAEEEYWQHLLEEKFPQVVRLRKGSCLTLDLPSLGKYPFPLRLRCYRRALEELLGNLRQVNLAHILAMEQLLQSSRPNKQLHLPQGVCVEKAYAAMRLSRVKEEPGPFEFSVPGPGWVEIAEISRSMRFAVEARKPGFRFPDSSLVALLNYDDLEFPLTVRSFHAGDRFQPLGMAGEKKVKDFFIDCKIPLLQRKQIPLVLMGDRLLWIGGLRIDHRARVQEATRQLLRVELL